MLIVYVCQPDVMQFTACLSCQLALDAAISVLLIDDQFDCVHLFVIQFLLACASGLAKRLFFHCLVFIACMSA